jgi:hypothetical protein
MYPSKRLTCLAARKAALQTRIALRRTECVEAGLRVERTLAEIAAWRRRLRRMAFFGSLGVALTGGVGRLVRRKRHTGAENGSAHKGWGLLRWVPVAVQAFRLVRSVSG